MNDYIKVEDADVKTTSKSVFIITSGSYSDYHIVKCFTTHTAALEWLGLFKDEDYAIEEHDLDFMEDKLVAKSGFMRMDFTTGKVIEHRPSLYDRYTKDIMVHIPSYSSIVFMDMHFDYYDVDRMTKVMGEKRAHIRNNLTLLYPQVVAQNPKQLEFDRETCLIKKQG